MVYYCCIKECWNTNDTINMFVIRKDWIATIGPNLKKTGEISEKALKNRRICRRHFKESDFDKGSLRPDILPNHKPSIFGAENLNEIADQLDANIEPITSTSTPRLVVFKCIFIACSVKTALPG